MKKLLLLGLILFTSCTKHEDTNRKTLDFALGDDTKNLDPAVAYDTVAMDIIPLVAESLYQYKYAKTPLELEPLLADGMPTISADKKTYTVKIKKGVLWQDDPIFPNGKGREVKAEDFFYAWKRLAIPEIQSPGTWIFNEKVAGWDDFKKHLQESKNHLDLSAPIEGFQVIDNYTLQIKLLRPYPQLLHILAMAYTSPLPKEIFDKYGMFALNEKIIGTGPYKFKLYVAGSRVVLEKNPTFRGEKYPDEVDETARAEGLADGIGKQLPFVEEVTFHIFKEDQPRFLQFRKGNLDVSGIPKDEFSSVVDHGALNKEMAEKGIQFQKLEQASLYYIMFNMKDPILGPNLNLRKAISMAINRDEFNEKFRNGRGIKATSIIPRVVPGYSGRTSLPYDYDVEKAKEYLAKAGFPNGKGLPVLKFDLRGMATNYRLQAEFIKIALEKIGIKMEVVMNTFPGYLEKERNGNLQFLLTVWDSDYPDPENFLSLLKSKNASPGPNIANYKNAKFDALVEKISLLSHSPERTKLIQEAEEEFYKDLPWAPMFYPLAFSVGHGWVKNFRPNIQITNHMKYFDVDLELKKKLKANL